MIEIRENAACTSCSLSVSGFGVSVRLAVPLQELRGLAVGSIQEHCIQSPPTNAQGGYRNEFERRRHGSQAMAECEDVAPSVKEQIFIGTPSKAPANGARVCALEHTVEEEMVE